MTKYELELSGEEPITEGGTQDFVIVLEISGPNADADKAAIARAIEKVLQNDIDDPTGHLQPLDVSLPEVIDVVPGYTGRAAFA